jgi:hypothetical protein
MYRRERTSRDPQLRVPTAVDSEGEAVILLGSTDTNLFWRGLGIAALQEAAVFMRVREQAGMFFSEIPF